MITEIFIVSYTKDIPYLEWCLRSIQKFASGFGPITVHVPKSEESIFKTAKLVGKPHISTYERTPDKRRWHLHAQAQKCFAEQHCLSADFIMHLDSDCIFTEPVTPNDYFINGKPVMEIETYARLKDCPWKPVVDQILKSDCQYETMRRHPQVNPRAIYPALRSYISQLHNADFERFVISRKADFPWGFTEHNVIGSFALMYMSKRYHWIDLGKEAPPKDKLKQFWSWGPIDAPQDSPHDHDKIIPLEVCRKLLK